MNDEIRQRFFDPELEGPFPSAWEDQQRAKLTPDTPQSASAAYRLGFADNDLLLRDELRPTRLQLEFLKPELLQQDRGIRATIAVFGSARIPAPAEDTCPTGNPARPADESPDDPASTRDRQIARSLQAKAHYYDEARRLARLISAAFGPPSCPSEAAVAAAAARSHQAPPAPAHPPVGSPRRAEPPCGTAPGLWTDSHCQPVRPHAIIITGGGPGIMEAANRGAHDAGTDSIGLNIVLPFEQGPNPYITPELCFNFHYFALRKMHFLMRAVALAVFPGGFGTLDELFDVLTLIQTGKITPIPVLLFGKSFWNRVIDFDALVDEGMVSPEDLDLFTFVETADEAWKRLQPVLQAVMG
jgi:hypothetical protein